MSTHTQQVNGNDTDAPQWPVFAALGAAVASILTAIGTFVDVFGPKEERSNGMEEFYSWLVAVGIIAVATALIFGLAVRTARRGNPSTRALVMALLAVPTVIVAWSGLPPVLAAGATACALAARESRGRFSGQDKVSLALVVVAMAGAITFALAG